MDARHPSTGVIGMYYGPNYDASDAGVSTSPSVSSPDQLTDKELRESDEPHDQGHEDDHEDDDDHRNDDNHMEDHDHNPHEHVDDLDHGDDLDCENDLDRVDDHDHGDEEDDDDDWITPDNLHRAREQMGGATTVPAKGVAVGCLTTDFSMQVYGLPVCLPVCLSVCMY